MNEQDLSGRVAVVTAGTGGIGRAIAEALYAAGAMTADADGRFNPTRAATGGELESVVRRVGALNSR